MNTQNQSNQIDAYSVNLFCATHHISRALLYRLIKDGRGPRLTKIGRRSLISKEAATAWRKAMEAKGGTFE